MHAKPLRLLLLDPSADDAELTLASLRAGGRRLKAERVADARALRRALGEPWDAVVSEHIPPQIDALAVLDALAAAGQDVPLVVLARALPDEALARLMGAGVRDVVLKNQLARLAPALERELADAAERAAQRALQGALREMEQKYRAVVQAAREAVCYAQDGMHREANRAYLELFGYADLTELEGVPVLDLIDKADHARFRRHMRDPQDLPGPAQEFAAVRRNGERIHIEVAVSRVTIDGEACAQLLVSDVSKRKAAEARLLYLHRHDPLTGLYNRGHFLELLENALAGARQSPAPPRAAVYLELQDARRVIRAHGHAAADGLLLAVARELRETLGPQAALARYGDHELAALVEDVTPAQLDSRLAQLRETLVAGPLADSGVPAPFGFHLSAAAITADTQAAHALMARLYAGNGAGPAVTGTPAARARVAPPPARLTAKRAAPRPRRQAAPTAAAPVDWKRRIADALEQGTLRLIYQPVVNLHAEPAECFEVLVRLLADDGSLVPARVFIREAEASGQAPALDRWVLDQAIRTLAELRGQERRVVFFINVSTPALGDPALLLAVRAALHENGVGGEHVVFEIDETALTGAIREAGAFVRAVERIGARVCIDNFGRARPDIEAVRAGAIEYLKLDAALCAHVASDLVAQASLRGMVEVAKALGKKTIAKGVESAETLSVLWELGVDYVQGNYLQEGDAELNYQFEDQATLTSEHVPPWAVADSDKSR